MRQFDRKSIREDEDTVLVVTYDYPIENEILFDKINISIFEHSDIGSIVVGKEEAKQLIEILKEAIK